jgi:hypothetical protein
LITNNVEIHDMEPQMGSVGPEAIEGSGSALTSENVTFDEAVSGHMYDTNAYVDPTRKLQDSDDADLGDFFKRPIKIREFGWGTGLSIGTSFNPWDDFFSNKRVINRINNFELLRCNLHLKFVLNGNHFMYGRAIASYLPYHIADTLTTNRTIISQDVIGESQRPHVYLDPCTSQGGELLLPFFWHRNYMSITRTDWSEMGEITLRSINDLKHANGASDSVSISVFAWAEDVEVSVLTSLNSTDLIAQMGTKETTEANKEGVISKPATTVAKVASTLRTIPPIAPFAMATEIAATAVSDIAKAFGYSRPPVTRASMPVQTQCVGQFATTNTPDNVTKLTYDDLQELTVDPRISGLDNDCDNLAIKSIAGRESYLTTFGWATSTSAESLLWNVRVQPSLWDEVAVSGKTEYHLTPVAVASMPFAHWTGSLKFRFQIVCSGFHKGRLKFVYDPNYIESNEYNINYMKIVDISETKDVTMQVGNGQNLSLVSKLTPAIDSVTQCFSTTPYASVDTGNGTLAVYVVNELTVPNSTINNDIQINVFVSAADDFEVFIPIDHFQNFVFRPQSGTLSDTRSTANNGITASEIHMLGPTMTVSDKLSAVYCGETVSSMRNFLKRYNLSRRLGNSPGTTGKFHQYTMANFPMYRGRATAAVDTTDSLIAYNYVNTVHLHWITTCFSGWRGSIRWKTVAANTKYDYDFGKIEAQRFSDVSSYTEDSTNTFALTPGSYPASTAVTAENISTSRGKDGIPCSGVEGMVITNGSYKQNLEFEVPFYSRDRFAPGKTDQWTINFIYGGFYLGAEQYANSTGVLDLYCAAGEDYQAYFWTGMPRLFYEQTPPIPYEGA